MTLEMVPAIFSGMIEREEGEEVAVVQNRGALRLEPCPDWVERSKVPITLRKAGDPFTNLLRDNRVNVPERTTYCRNVVRLEGAQAVQQMSRVEIPFDPEIQTLLIHGISIFRNGLLTNHAKLEEIEMIRRETQLEAGVVNGEVSALQLLRDVRIGDVLDVEFSFINHGGLFADLPSCLQTLGGRFPVGLWRFSWIDQPENPVEILNKAEGFDQCETTTGGLLERSWISRNTLAQEPEIHIPQDALPFPFIQISPFRSWEGVVRRFTGTWNSTVTERTGLNEELAAIREAAGEDAGRKIELAVSSARDAVRYQNYSPGLLSVVPEEISKVWARRFGDCKEKSMLLVWLLREMGFAAEPVLVATVIGRILPDLLPSPQLFDHVITRVRLADKTLWIDPTDSYRGSHPLTWEGLSFHHGLPLADGPAGLVVIPPLPPSGLRVDETVEAARGSKTTKHELRFSFRGRRADHMRGLLDAQGLTGARRALKGFMEATRKGIEIEGDIVTLDDRSKNEIEVRFDASCVEGIKSNPERSTDQILITPFVFMGMLPIVETARRQHAVGICPPDSVEQNVKVRHPDLTKADYPLHTADNAAFSAKVDSKMVGNDPMFSFRLEIKKDRVEVENVAAFRRDVEKTHEFADVCINLPKSVGKGEKKYRAHAPRPAYLPGSRRLPYGLIGVAVFLLIKVIIMLIANS